MRIIVKILLALGLVFVAEGGALAYVAVDVDLSSQTMRVHSTDGGTYTWPISSGRERHATPRGVFHPQRLYTMVHSAKSGNAPMPHSIFSHGQYAIHGTTAVGSPASNGCIRLSPAHAAILFAMVQSQGAQIRIEGSAPGQVAHVRHRHGSEALAFAPVHRAQTLDEWARNPTGW
jgi:L,D-transpeptidase catalytic domain